MIPRKGVFSLLFLFSLGTWEANPLSDKYYLESMDLVKSKLLLFFFSWKISWVKF